MLKRKPQKQMKRSAFKRKPTSKRARLRRSGPRAQLRSIGNDAAREFYFREHGKEGTAPCQSCGEELRNHNPRTQAHHKQQSGEDLMNKLVLCSRCHLLFVHDLNFPGHRKAAELDHANVVNGFRINWHAFGLQEAFKAFRDFRAQPKGVKVPGKQLRCQGCQELQVEGLKVYVPCSLHQKDNLDPLFGDRA